VAALAVIALLSTLELADWQTIRTQDHLVVDMGSPVDKMKVLFNVTFPRIPCSCMPEHFDVVSTHIVHALYSAPMFAHVALCVCTQC